MPLDPGLIEAVRQVLSAVEGDAEASLDSVAQAVNLSPRTLQRHLRAMGTTLRHEYDIVRMSRAQTLLADPQYSLMEIAFLLGFAEQSTFHRAFKRWSGMSPYVFRQEILARLVIKMSSPVKADDPELTSANT